MFTRQCKIFLFLFLGKITRAEETKVSKKGKGAKARKGQLVKQVSRETKEGKGE